LPQCTANVGDGSKPKPLADALMSAFPGTGNQDSISSFGSVRGAAVITFDIASLSRRAVSPPSAPYELMPCRVVSQCPAAWGHTRAKGLVQCYPAG
jgi:hypothetical protein